MIKNIIYTIPKNKHNEKDLRQIFEDHPEIKFVSLVGIDLSGNDTDEKIPSKVFLDDIDQFLNGVAVQTDGSSVALPGIATLNNAKVDMVADIECNWFVDYNYDFIDKETNLPIGTLRIPCFLLHEGVAVDSRSILKSAIDTFKSTIMDLFKKYPESLSTHKITADDIEEVVITSATELEFWVKTPNDKAEVDALTASEVLQEQYWTKTKGPVRTALEETLLLMEEYGFEPEMGHKEVGGVKAKLDSSGNYNHIMEQLEVDWKYSNAIQAADNELFVKNLIQDTFIRRGLETTFMAKPIEDVAGNGMHVHLGVSLKLKNGKRLNIFNGPSNHFLSTVGYGAILGLLKNYEIMNPFISSTNNSLKRLKPGFEAPICVVTSLGITPDFPSRNRTILIGLIRDLANPLATRFELRSPNPHTNTYLAMAVSYMAMLDGICYALENKRSEDELLAELSKKPGENASYLEKDRAYRSEEDVFEYYTEDQRTQYFGVAPKTIYENIIHLKTCSDKLSVLKRNDVFNDKLINSFTLAVLNKWNTEITKRVLNGYMDEVRECKMLHSLDRALDLDVSNWMEINELRHYLAKDSYTSKSLFTRVKEAFANEDYKLASDLQIELEDKMCKLRNLYSKYTKNLLDI